MRHTLIATLFAAAAMSIAPNAFAEDCKCLAIAGDLTGAIVGEVARADSLYAKGDFDGAFAIYAKVYASSKDSTLLYAQAMTKWRLGNGDDARSLFDAYLKAGGTLAYRAEAEVRLRELGGGVKGRVGGVLGDVRDTGGDVVGGVGGTVVGVGTAGASITGDIHGRLDRDVKPPKVAKGAAIVLGVVAIAAVGAVGIHSIAAGLKDDIELDAKFDLGLGLTGVSVGITAIYLYGLTAAVGTAGSLKCATLPAGKPIIAPFATAGGGGLATAMTF